MHITDTFCPDLASPSDLQWMAERRLSRSTRRRPSDEYSGNDGMETSDTESKDSDHHLSSIPFTTPQPTRGCTIGSTMIIFMDSGIPYHYDDCWGDPYCEQDFMVVHHVRPHHTHHCAALDNTLVGYGHEFGYYWIYHHPDLHLLSIEERQLLAGLVAFLVEASMVPNYWFATLAITVDCYNIIDLISADLWPRQKHMDFEWNHSVNYSEWTHYSLAHELMNLAYNWRLHFSKGHYPAFSDSVLADLVTSCSQLDNPYRAADIQYNNPLYPSKLHPLNIEQAFGDVLIILDIQTTPPETLSC
jgi:hypothetical protein